jgi:hypothetical protein
MIGFNSLPLLLAGLLVLPACGGAASRSSAVNDPSEEAPLAAWERILSAYHHAGGLDYAGVLSNREDLDTFVESLSEARPAELNETEQLAFWINAYNALVAYQVLKHYPEIESVKDVAGFFDGVRFAVAGERMTLDEVEGRGRDLGDPRVHFAVVCASTSCPDLRFEPYRAEILDRQLEEQTRGFLTDPSKGARWDEKGNDLWLSSIFKWYAGDFTGGSTAVAFLFRGGVLDWVLLHLPADLADSVRSRSPEVRYMDYDWSLNDRAASGNNRGQ